VGIEASALNYGKASELHLARMNIHEETFVRGFAEMPATASFVRGRALKQGRSETVCFRRAYMNVNSFRRHLTRSTVAQPNKSRSFICAAHFISVLILLGGVPGVEKHKSHDDNETQNISKSRFSIRSRSVITHFMGLMLLSARYYVMRPPKSRSLTSGREFKFTRS
jgi:hypothetical protein